MGSRPDTGGTYQQWQQLGGQVKKRPDNVPSGQWGTNIMFFRKVQKTKFNSAGEEKVESFPIMTLYTEFNLDQVEGEKLDPLPPSTDSTEKFPDITEAEKVIVASGAEI